MKAIFLCDKINMINQVYQTSVIEDMCIRYGADRTVYTKKMILQSTDRFKDTEYIFSTWGMPSFEQEEIQRYFPNLKGVFYAAGSVQSFARPFIKNGIKVFSAWGANAVPVAEYTVAQIILANKGFYSASRMFKNREYSKARNLSDNYPGNYNAKVGIIGAGMIGKLVITMLKAYNLQIFVFDPFLTDDDAEILEVEKVHLERIFSECNVISNHLANNEHTKNIFTYELFSLMPKYATFLNTGRGAQVVEKDLIKLLNERKDVTAVLDVTMPEPPLESSELYELDNCVLTPHIAGSKGCEIHRMAEFMVREFECYVGGMPCQYEVTEKMLETMA